MADSVAYASTEKRSHTAERSAYDLKFVPFNGDCSDGAWYRELPDAQVEVMSHARLQRVPLEGAEPEAKVREVAGEIVDR